MKLLIQRTKGSSVTVNDHTNTIEEGLVVLVSFTHNDTEEIINKMINKLINLRIFEDENELMNKSLLDIKGSILSISQFTLYANCKEGRKPSFKDAMNAHDANDMYDIFNKKIKDLNINIKTGVFGGDMQVMINNDGPVTIMLDSNELF